MCILHTISLSLNLAFKLHILGQRIVFKNVNFKARVEESRGYFGFHH